ncbi:hypothetical protein TTHERM_01205290 (macronuclear) [Tetrahymena thermophila SB210]|uniref:Uncharacterized protein n=1 Tax=Tetrahymena thermophila (strain SB210) TaxID=312017 RepID=Q22AI1_TETTS|nr:hypothetical protein TTHERM_01205290 [Tetrahymena thermophila SB210]EAR82293.2 hypothetical protein TTHERM_01205290 [Tetrahymena thermophila SB210]|eukprot:XP_001029956.2 hypothetical protein TTHERM_01205290 [Tetrahymena thermophila SB210]
MQKIENSQYQGYKMKNDISIQKGFLYFDDNNSLFSPRSNIDYRINTEDSVEQFNEMQDYPILSQQSFDSNQSKDIIQKGGKLPKRKFTKKMCLSLATPYSFKENNNSNWPLRNNSGTQLINNEMNCYFNSTNKFIQQQQIYQQQPYLAPQTSTSLNQAQSNLKKPIQQSIFYKNENSSSMLYDCNDKKEFFRAIKFNLFNKKRNSGIISNSSQVNIIQQQNSQQNMKKYISTNETLSEKKNLQNRAPILVQQNDIDSPQSCEKIANNNKQIQYFQNSSSKPLNLPSSNFNQIQKQANQLIIPNEFLTPQSRIKNSQSSRVLATSTFSDSIESQTQTQNKNTPLTQKDKKNNDRIQKIMSFNLAKEMNKIVSKIKQQRQKEQNPSILKLPSIKSSQSLQKEKQTCQSQANLELNEIQFPIYNSTSNLSNLSKQIQILGTKKKQVHFIIDEIDQC